MLMKITLISPYEEIYAIGIRILSSCLKKAGHDIQVIFLRNCFYDRYKGKTLDEVAGISKEADLIGVSLMTNLFENAVQITQMLRKNLHVPILWGGIHPTIRPEECLDYASMVCIGEGEETFVELARRMGDGADFYNTQGMWFKDKRRIIKNKLRPLISDLDLIPFPDYSYENHWILDGGHIVKMDKNLLKKYFWSRSIYPILATRGCPFSCTYCCNNTINEIWPEQKSVRKRGIENIIRELIEAKNNLPFIEKIIFDDDSFFSYSEEEIMEFCAKYKKNIMLPFGVGGVTPVTLNREKLSLLVDAGLTGIRMGIQTGSERTKRLYKRYYSNEQVEEAVKMINEFKDKIKSPTYDIILDNPWETDEDLCETLMLLLRLPPPYYLGLYSLTFYPETELYELAKKDGLIFDESKNIYNKWMFGLKKGYLNKLFILMDEYTRSGSKISNKLMLLLTDRKLRKLKLSYLLYLVLKIKVNRISWVKDLLYRSLNDIKRGDLSKISLFIKRYLRYKRF